MTTCFAIIMCLTIGQPETLAGPNTDQAATLKSQVRRLIRQLDADQPAARRAAETDLIKLGPPILPLLPSKTARLSPEVRRHLDDIVQQLETALATQIVQPTHVRLEGKMTCTDVFAAIEKQTGNRLAGYENSAGDESMQVEFADTVFWRALDTVLDRLHADVAIYGGQPRTLTIERQLHRQATRVGHACYRGPFRFEATEVSAVRSLRDAEFSGMRLRLEVMWEPRLHPITLTLPLGSITAVDDAARNVGVLNPDGVINTIVEASTSGVELDVPFHLPDRSARSLATVGGRLAVLLPGREEAFEFHDLADSKNVELRKADVAVTFLRLVKNEDVTEIQVRVRFDDAADALQSHLGWIYHNEAFLRDSTGKQLEQAGVQLTGRSENEVTLVYLFALEKAPQEYTLVYKTPTLLLKKEIPFELVKLRLP